MSQTSIIPEVVARVYLKNGPTIKLVVPKGKTREGVVTDLRLAVVEKASISGQTYPKGEVILIPAGEYSNVVLEAEQGHPPVPDLQNEDNANAIAWLEKGNVAVALSIGERRAVEHALADKAFGTDVLVILNNANATPGVITGYSDSIDPINVPGIFTIDGALDINHSNAATINGISRVVSWDLEDEARQLKEAMTQAAGGDAPSYTKVVRALTLRPGEELDFP